MTVAGIILAALLALAVVLLAARPLLRGGEEDAERADPAEAERLRRLEERDRALAALKELEFDHRTGKISDEDYAALVASLRREAAEALAALDAPAGGRQEPAG